MLDRRNLETRADAIPRMRLNNQLLAELHISEVGGQPVASNSRKVLLHHMSGDEAEFSTTLRFPVHDRYRLTFSLQLGRKHQWITGRIVSRVKQKHLYLYELQIIERSIPRTEWLKELNDWKLRHQPALPAHKVHYLYRN